ncbi:MAG: hypothetical protein RR329_06060 [Mucinivorans sp.]
MNRKIIRVLVACLSLLYIEQSHAQFYYQGRGSASELWMQIQTPKYKLLYPDYFAPTAIRMAGFLDSLQPYISQGIIQRRNCVPIIMRPQNQYSNGFVVWAPKREEMVPTAPIDNTATPWLKQLMVHEWRHVAQMSTMRTGLTKVASWLLGEAGITVGLLAVSKWALEGDATNAETQMAEYGRGLQPDFTIEYRAMAYSHPRFYCRPIDTWVSSSFKDHVPDVYKYGYQVLTAAETYCSPTVWGEVMDYSAKWPILIVPDNVYLRRHYGTTFRRITRRAFAELDSLWRPHSVLPNDFQTITTHERSYTTYSYPQATSSGGILSLKSDYDTPARFVIIDSLAHEHTMHYVGAVSSRPIISNDKLYWTEYKPHLIYEQKNFSIIRSYDLSTGQKAKFLNWQSNYLVTPLDGGFATVANDSLANGYIRFFDKDFVPLTTYHFAEPTTLHGLAWDDSTHTLAFIALDERGMSLCGLHIEEGRPLGELFVLKSPSAVTLKDLSAGHGRFFFGSIASGKDEVHTLDIASAKEYQLTSSRFGSGAPSLTQDDSLLLTTYSDQGWLVGITSADTTSRAQIQWSRLPKNLLNPTRYKWQVPQVDTIAMDDTTTTHQVKRYRKFGRQFNFHSWAPLAVDFSAIQGGADERSSIFGWGATGFFQSTLSDMYGSLAVGLVRGEFWTKGGFTYTGLPIQVGVTVEYGGGNNLNYSKPFGVAYNPTPFFSATVNLSLPLNFSGGALSRLLQPSFSSTYYNAKLYNPDGTYHRGSVKWAGSLWWSTSRRSSSRSITPRLGYALRADVAGAYSTQFGTYLGIWARGYLPGILPNHSITICAGAQWQSDAQYAFSSKVLVPTGMTDPYAAKRYAGGSVNYNFPIFYPDCGWDGVIFFNRVWSSLFFDYAAGDYYTTSKDLLRQRQFSYGANLGIDFNLFRTYGMGVTLTFAKPSNDKFWFGFALRMKL